MYVKTATITGIAGIIGYAIHASYCLYQGEAGGELCICHPGVLSVAAGIKNEEEQTRGG